MRINNEPNHHFQMSGAGKKAKPEETDKQHQHGDKPVEMRIQDILDISGKVPKLPGYMQDGKFYLEAPEELNRTLQSDFGYLFNGEEYKFAEYPGVDEVYSRLEDLKTKYQYGIGWKTSVDERLADKELVMRGITAIAQKFNISNEKLNDFMKQMKGLADDYTFTYDTYGNSELLSINDEGRRTSYYSNLFISDIESANRRAISGGGGSGWLAHNVDLSLKRYEELRTEIQKTFGDDQELLQKNLDSLDKAFSWNLERVALTNARYLESERMMDHAAKITGEKPLWEPNKLASHKNFNMDKFYESANKTMQQFAQEYIEQIKSGMSYASAWGNAVEILTNSTKTTSVNNLSFSDLMILDSRPVSNATTRAENIIVRNNQSLYFNNNPNLSEALRKLLGMA